jgi:hypothetical protein
VENEAHTVFALHLLCDASGIAKLNKELIGFVPATMIANSLIDIHK